MTSIGGIVNRSAGSSVGPGVLSPAGKSPGDPSTLGIPSLPVVIDRDPEIKLSGTDREGAVMHPNDSDIEQSSRTLTDAVKVIFNKTTTVSNIIYRIKSKQVEMIRTITKNLMMLIFD